MSYPDDSAYSTSYECIDDSAFTTSEISFCMNADRKLKPIKYWQMNADRKLKPIKYGQMNADRKLKPIEYLQVASLYFYEWQFRALYKI